MVRVVLDFAFARAHFNRNSSMNSSTGTKRPDFLFHLNGVCVFRGEEKEPGTNLRLPREELSEKLIWTYGTVPYVFGYAASGYKIDLFALFRSTGELSNVESMSIGYFDVELVSDRFRLVLALLNLSLLFSAITEACPDSGRNEYMDFYRNSGVVVRLHPTFVETTFPKAESLEHVRQIYGVLKAAKVPNVDGVFEVEPSKKAVLLKPRGDMVKPSNLMELFVALRNILEALVVLHRESWIHRDIRWSNVIKRRDCDTWFLIDFMDAAQSPQYYPSGDHLSKEEHAPEIFVVGGTHTTAVDIWAVGYTAV